MLISYHNDQFIKKLIKYKILTIDKENGLVYSKRYRPTIPRGTKNAKGYLVCTLHQEGKRIQAKVHRIVWLSVNKDIPKGFVIDHINRNKSDNRLKNLRLADAKLNSNNRRSYFGSNNPSAKINLEIATRIRKEYENKDKSSYKKISNKFKISPTLVANIIRGELWKN